MRGGGSRRIGVTAAKRDSMRGVYFDDAEVLKLLQSKVKAAGRQVAFARRHRVERTFLNKVLNGARGIPPSILDLLNLRVVYTPIRRR